MPKHLLEAALFLAPQPLKVEKLAELTGLKPAAVRQLLADLAKDYEGRGIHLAESAAGWKLQVRGDLLPRVAHLTPYHDLTEGCKRTLAFVVYKEPVTQSEIIRSQGNKAYDYVHRLEKLGMVTGEKQGRTRLLRLTPEFERYFGQDKESIRAQIQAREEPLPPKPPRPKEPRKFSLRPRRKAKPQQLPPAGEGSRAFAPVPESAPAEP